MNTLELVARLASGPLLILRNAFLVMADGDVVGLVAATDILEEIAGDLEDPTDKRESAAVG